MTVYSFYIFDRHTECIYAKRWTQRPTSKDSRPQSNASMTNGLPTGRNQLSAADDAKLIFGVIFSLRNMVRKIGGEYNDFMSYRTGEYKLHYYETPTKLKFVMLTDIKTNNLRNQLHQIWSTPYVEFVVKNPLSPVEHPAGLGVVNEKFEASLNRFLELSNLLD